MIPNGVYRAVVDRHEGDLLVLEATDEETEERYELVVEADALPEAGRAVDSVLAIEVDDEDVVDAVYRKAETEATAEKAQSRFDRLARRPPKDE